MRHDGTTILFGLPGVRVRHVERDDDGVRVVHVVTDDETAAACPQCGVFSSSVRQRRTTRPRDLPYGEQQLVVRWHKVQYACREQQCPRKAFTEQIGELPAGARLTGRLRRSVAHQIGDGLAVSVASHGVMSWPIAHAAFVKHADGLLTEPGPVRVLCIDETRRGRPRWTPDETTGKWVKLERFETNFVDLSGRQGLLGQASGRRKTNVIEWLDARGQDWKDSEVRKRRFRCAEQACARRSFTEVTGQLPARARVTTRLRERVCSAVITTHRAVKMNAAEYGLSWPTVHRTLVVQAAEVLGQAAPTAAIGVDETRSRRVRWLREEAGWPRTDPWLTSIVDLAGSGGIIGLAPGRSGACLAGWLSLQTQDFRDEVQVVAIDPSAPYAAAIRRELPAATVVVDHFHLVMLANQAVTEVRQRAQREQHARRGMKVDPAWAHRRLLLRAGDRPSKPALARLGLVLAARRPDRGDRCRLGLHGAASAAACRARPEPVQPA